MIGQAQAERREQERRRRAAWIAMAIMGTAFAVLASHLYRLQVTRGAEFRAKSKDNFVQLRKVPAVRGRILDRRGRELVVQKPSFDVYITPAFLKKHGSVFKRLDELLRLSLDDVDRVTQKLREARGLERFRPVLVRSDISREQLDTLEFYREELPGVDILPSSRREYPYGPMAAHLLGYMAEIRPEELERGVAGRKDYERGDLMGRRGIEMRHERELRGFNGLQQTVVDARGRAVNDPARLRELVGEPIVEPAIPGSDVHLALDLDLQLAAERAADAMKAGAIVAMDPKTGDIWAMVSRPAYDPNLLSTRLSPSQWRILVSDPLKPLTNRALQQHYPPGSVFKIVAALAGLEEGVINPDTALTCPGAYVFGGRPFRCHKEKGHGVVRLREALAWSCDVFFYKLGEALGSNRMAKYARLLGAGQRAGLGDLGEVPGVVPDVAYHEQHTPGGYQRGYDLNTAIGQGSVTVTPLQLAIIYATLVNGGHAPQARVVTRITAADGHVEKEIAPVLNPTHELEAANLQAVNEALVAVVNSPGGTAYARRLPHVPVLGKTGTAQVIAMGEKRVTSEELDWWVRDHAFFIGITTIEDPQLVVAVAHEHGGHGSSGAAPIAMAVLKSYLELSAPRN